MTYYIAKIVLWISVNIGINHCFQCSNIRWITRKVFEHKAAGRVFKHLPSDPANVWTLKQTMVDRYSCIFTLFHLKSLENNISNVKTHRKQRSFFNVGHFVSTKHMTSHRIDQWRRPKPMFKRHVNFMNWTWVLLFEHGFRPIEIGLKQLCT